MEELETTIERLEIEQCYLRNAIMKPTNYGRCPDTAELLGLFNPIEMLGKVVFALEILRDLKDDIKHNIGE